MNIKRSLKNTHSFGKSFLKAIYSTILKKAVVPNEMEVKIKTKAHSLHCYEKLKLYNLHLDVMLGQIFIIKLQKNLFLLYSFLFFYSSFILRVSHMILKRVWYSSVLDFSWFVLQWVTLKKVKINLCDS